MLMLAALASLFALLAAVARTAPAAPAEPVAVDLTARGSTPAWCSGLSGATTDTPRKNFTLAALYTTRHNANSTGVPLVLGQAGAISGAQLEVLSTWASYPYNQWKSLGLIGGRLYANSDFGTPTYSGLVLNNAQPGFITTTQQSQQPPQQYCVQKNAPKYKKNLLAVNGRSDLFSLCQTGTSPLAQNNVWYNAKYPLAAGTVCYPVVLVVVDKH